MIFRTALADPWCWPASRRGFQRFTFIETAIGLHRKGRAMKAEVATQIMVVALGFCPLDGVPFVILDGKARFCSPECRRVWEEIRKTEPPFPNILELSLKPCEWCDRPYH